MTQPTPPIMVVKRDGTLQPFHPDKIIQVLEAAGAEVAESIQIAQAVTEWAQSQPNHQVTSLQIRDNVLKFLEKVNPSVANLFRWYQKTKG